MKRDISQETLENFLREVRPQVADLSSSWAGWQVATDDGNNETCGRLRGIAHRLKGEASIIGLSDFSHVAAFLEELLDEVARYGCNEQRQNVIEDSLVAATQYLDDLLDPVREEQDCLSAAVLSYRRYRELPESGDADALQRLLYDTHEELSVDGPPEAELLHQFRLDAGEQVQRMIDTVGQTETLEAESVLELRRSLHTVKGAASTVGLHEIAELSHGLENLLESILQDQVTFEAAAPLLVSSLDTLGGLIDGDQDLADLPESLRKLEEFLGQSEQSQQSAVADTQTPEVGNTENIEQTTLAREIEDDLNANVAPELLEVYAEEAEDHIKLIYNHLNALQTNPDDREALQGVRRSAHTLKGAAGAVGLRIVTKLSHRMEDLLDLLYEQQKPPTQEMLNLLLVTTDQLNDLSFGEFDREEVVDGIQASYAGYDAHLGEQAQVEQSSKSVEIRYQPAVVAQRQEEAESDQVAAREKESVTAERAAEPKQVLRVPLERVDDLVRTVSELIINRTTFEQKMSDFVQGVDELNVVLERIRAVSNEMETRFSVDALGRSSILAAPTQSKEQSLARYQIEDANQSEFDTLELDRYNEFHILARSIGEVAADVNAVTNEFHTLIGDFDSLLARQDRLSRETQDRLMRVRMVPLATLTTRLHRAVRVVASSQEKQVELIVEGENTEFDKTVLEEIADPLLHLLRNAVDHGVEPADLRLVKGKPPKATIRIRAFYQGTQAVLRISDDGAGLDMRRIGETAVQKGVVSQADLESMTPQEIFPLIFVPGLSTAKEISEVSGRGVGMDIVRDKVQKLKGTIAVDSEPDKGTTFTIRLPLTLAVTRALMVIAGNEMFAVPMQSVDQIARLPREDVEQLGDKPVVRLNGRVCPLIRLSEHLGLRENDNNEPTIPVLIVASGDNTIAVRVEKIIAGRDIVVKTLGSHLRKVNGLLGATLLGDGTVVPILDPNSLSNQDQLRVDLAAQSSLLSATRNTTVMIVDDSVSVRKVMENLARSQGWTPVVAKDGVDALEILPSLDTKPDIFLLDVEMPRMDGYELLATLRGMTEYRDVPVVMVTSRSGEKHRNKAFSLGASEYLVKPYQDERLIGLVQKLTAGSKESTLA